MIALVSGSRKILSSLSVATWGPAWLSGLIRSSLAHLCQDDDTSSISFVGTRPWATDSISARCRDSAVSWTMPILAAGGIVTRLTQHNKVNKLSWPDALTDSSSRVWIALLRVPSLNDSGARSLYLIAGGGVRVSYRIHESSIAMLAKLAYRNNFPSILIDQGIHSANF